MKEEKEQYDVKYIRELLEYTNIYFYSLINEIYVGVAVNLGISENNAYKLAKNNPNKLEKANFFKSVFNKFKSIFKHKVPKFRYKKKKIWGDGKKPMTPEQWDKFSDAIDRYWSEHANKVAEDMAIKSHELGKQTTRFRYEKKPYKNKSLFQVNFEQYDNNMPSDLVSAYKNYDFSNAEKNALNKQSSSIAMHVKETGTKIEEAIRHQIQTGLDDNLSPAEVASNLYWNVEKNENLVNQYTAEAMRKNWGRIANTEMASVYEAGILSPYEAQAMESLKEPEKAVYLIFTGGSCSWCKAHQGVLVRLVPLSIVTDTANDSLQTMGIKDPNTDIAVWIGKNNINYKETKAIHEWRICTPAHPNNVATLQPIDPETEIFNEKTGDVEKRLEKKKFVPPQVDYSQKTKEEKEWRKPTFVGANLVRYNNNVYEAVDPSDFNKRLEESRKNSQLPIPVNKVSPQYRQIFDEAEKNK